MLFLATAEGLTFPAVDPIPLPAPVWLFKVLHDLTLALHFVTVHLLLGGLIIASILNWRGHQRRNAGWIEASGSVAGWLPVIMTYVINLGVPPLLFAQVLYGRALYTSSVLIAAYWIAVIPILIVCYHLLYRMAARASDSQPFYAHGLASFACAGLIAAIYSMNMTLMIDPTGWRETYRLNQTGTTILTGPAWGSRLLYMMTAGIAVGGILMLWLSGGNKLSTGAKETLGWVGSRLTLVGTIVTLVAGGVVWIGQSEAVRTACWITNPVWLLAVVVWMAGATGVLYAANQLIHTYAQFEVKLITIVSLAAFIQIAGFVLCRDLIRDAALASYGFDVWDRVVLTNWSVLILFLLLFVAGLGVVGWLVLLGNQARTTEISGDTV